MAGLPKIQKNVAKLPTPSHICVSKIKRQEEGLVRAIGTRRD